MSVRDEQLRVVERRFLIPDSFIGESLQERHQVSFILLTQPQVLDVRV
jgi:hypothetical protein